MLKLFSSLREIDTQQLMAVYIEGNRENGAENYPEDAEQTQIQKAEEDFISYLREDFFQKKDAVYAVWEIEKRYRAALRLEPYKDGLLLEALETAPEDRRRGYAFSLINAVLSILRGGKYRIIYSHINKRNLPSLGVHKKCGFTKISDSATYVDGTVTQRSCTMCYKL